MVTDSESDNDLRDLIFEYINRNRNSTYVFELCEALKSNRCSEDRIMTQVNDMRKEGLIQYTSDGITLTDRANSYSSTIEKNKMKPNADMCDTQSSDENGYPTYFHDGLISNQCNKDEILEIINSKNNTSIEHNILLKYFNGYYAEDIAEELKLPNSTVNETIMEFIDDNHNLYPEYQQIFKNYLFRRNLFCLMFNEPVSTYIFLDTICGCGKKNPFDITNEGLTIDPQNIQKVIDAIMFDVDSLRKEEGMRAIMFRLTYLLQGEPVEYRNIDQMYKSITSEDHTLRILNYKTLLSKLGNIIFTDTTDIRFLSDTQISNIKNNLDLEKYADLSISTSIILNDNRKLLSSNGIDSNRTLSKFIEKYMPSPYYEIKKNILNYGTTMEEQFSFQISDIPIEKRTAFCEEFCTKYGVEWKDIEQMLEKLFSSKDPSNPQRFPLSIEAKRIMEDALKFDWYTEESMRSVFRDKGMMEYCQLSDINALGYKKHGDLYYSSKYLSLEECLVSTYFSTNTVKLSDDFYDSKTFCEYLNKITLNMNFVKISKTALKNVESFKFDFKEAWRTCLLKIADACDVEYITPRKLYHMQICGELDDLDYGDSFYESILIPLRGMCTNKLGNVIIYHSHPFSGSDFLHRMLEENEGKMDRQDLIEYMDDEYGIALPLNRIKELCKDTEMFYEDELECFYINEEIYGSDIE